MQLAMHSIYYVAEPHPQPSACPRPPLVPKVQQQTEIEVNVHEATAEFLRHLASRLQDQSSAWSARRDEDYSSREHDLEQLKQNHQRDMQRLKDMEDKHAKELRLKQVRVLAGGGVGLNSMRVCRGGDTGVHGIGICSLGLGTLRGGGLLCEHHSPGKLR